MGDETVSDMMRRIDRIETKLDNVLNVLEKAAHGEGFARCARHSVRIKVVEAGVELCHNRISGVKKWIVGALITVATMLINYAWSILQTAAHKN